MNIESFRQANKPSRAKRSYLHNVLPEIRQLKAEGYTIAQIRNYLATRNIEVSPDALQKFWSRHLKAQGAPQGCTCGAGVSGSEPDRGK